MSSSNSSPNKLANTDAKPGQSSSRFQRRLLWYGIAGFLLFDGAAILAQVLFAPHTINSLTIIGDINNTLGWFLGALFCISRLPHSWWKRAAPAAIPFTRIIQQKITLWIAVVFFVNAIQSGAYIYYDSIKMGAPLDWPAIFLLLRYPFLLLSVLSLHRHPLSLIARLRLALDGLLVLTALITFSWYFLLGPIILEVHKSMFEKMVVIAYPLSDLILCFYLFQLSFRNGEPAFRLARRFFLLGLLSIVIADLFDLAQFLQANPLFALVQSVVLGLGYILIVFAVQDMHTINTRPSAPANEAPVEDISGMRAFPRFLGQSLLPSAIVPAVLLFMIIIWASGGTGPRALGVYLSGIALIILLVLRQILVMYETFISNRALQRIQKELYEKNLALEQANHRLEEQTQELATAYEQQRHANELKDQFLLNVNHELRTPLTEMHGYLELLHYYQGTIDTKMHARFLSHALNGSQELLRLVDTILDALRSEHARETLHSEEVSVNSVVQEAVEGLDLHKRDDYQLDLVVPAGLTVRADRQYLRQIFSNLLSNAFKYSPPQTAIIVGAQEVPIELPSANEHAQIHFWVQDHGPGIPPDNIAFLFSKFFRQARHQTSAIRGTGLGLYICKQLVEAMDGRIWVESSGVPGEGSRFCFTLPAILS